MKYSIIIAVYNRIEEVKELLASAEELDFPRVEFELLFIDDGSTDGFEEFVTSYGRDSQLNIGLAKQENLGPGAARNHGMRISKGEYFIFVDSDCMFPPHWLSAIEADLKKVEWDAFGGPDTFHQSFSDLLKAINYSMTSFLGTGGTRGSAKSIGRFYPRSFNMGLHRRVFEKIGGMNSLRHGQDMDFSARIYNNDFKVGFIERAYVYHKRRTSIPKFFRQIFNWGVARINLGRLHRSLLKPVHFLPSFLFLGTCFALLLYLLFNVRWPITFVMAGLMAISLLAFSQATIKYKNLRVGFLSIMTLNIQVLAYGLGVLWAAVQTPFRKESIGFVKNYYGKK